MIKMVAKQTTRYTLENTEEARFFAAGIEAFYGWGGAKVRIIEDGKLLIVEYDHFIDTKDTVFGG
jgi:hypothetical protein